MVSESLKLSFITGYYSNLAFCSVTSFFGFKGAFFFRFSQNDKTDLYQIFFSGFRKKTCSLHPALKSNAPGF